MKLVLSVQLLEDCATTEPKFRPKIDIIKNKLKKMFKMVSSDSFGMVDFHTQQTLDMLFNARTHTHIFITHHLQVEIYSHKLEEVVEKCQEELELERERSNTVFSCMFLNNDHIILYVCLITRLYTQDSSKWNSKESTH